MAGLYIARLTAGAGDGDREHRLRDPALADADREGYPVEFVLTTIGPDGPEYTTGTRRRRAGGMRLTGGPLTD